MRRYRRCSRVETGVRFKARRRGDALPGDELEILALGRCDVAAVLRNEHAVRECRAQVRAGDVDAIGFGYAVNAGRRVGNDAKLSEVGVVAFAPIHRETVDALIGDDEVSGRPGTVENRHALDIAGQVAAFDAIHHRPFLAAVRLGRVLPDGDVFFTYIEVTSGIVGDTAFRLGADAELTHQFGADPAVARVFQQPLPDQAIRVVDDHEVKA